MHLSYLSFRVALVQIELVLRTFHFFKIVYNRCIVLTDGHSLVDQLMRQWLVLTRLNALKLIALLLRKVVMMISQLLSMYPFNESGLHTISSWIISVY